MLFYVPRRAQSNPKHGGTESTNVHTTPHGCGLTKARYHAIRDVTFARTRVRQDGRLKATTQGGGSLRRKTEPRDGDAFQRIISSGVYPGCICNNSPRDRRFDHRGDDHFWRDSQTHSIGYSFTNALSHNIARDSTRFCTIGIPSNKYSYFHLPEFLTVQKWDKELVYFV